MAPHCLRTEVCSPEQGFGALSHVAPAHCSRTPCHVSLVLYTWPHDPTLDSLNMPYSLRLASLGGCCFLLLKRLPQTSFATCYNLPHAKKHGLVSSVSAPFSSYKLVSAESFSWPSSLWFRTLHCASAKAAALSSTAKSCVSPQSLCFLVSHTGRDDADFKSQHLTPGSTQKRCYMNVCWMNKYMNNPHMESWRLYRWMR